MMRKSVDNVNRREIAEDEAVLELVHTVMHQFRSLQYRALEGGTHGVTHMESKVLGFFAGGIVASAGYANFFVLTVLAVLPAALLCLWLWPRFRRLGMST